MNKTQLDKAIRELGQAELKRQARKAITRAKREGWADRIQNIGDLRAVLDGHYFEQSAAARAVAFFERILRIADRHDARKTKPFKLIAWQRRDVIEPLFGWMRPNGTRRFRRGQIWVPKKNGKTELASGIGLYLLTGDNEPNPEVYSAAVSGEQAALVYKAMGKMRARSPQLRKILEPVDYKKRITYRGVGGFYAVLPNRPGAVDGISPHGLIFDELHRQKSRELFDSLTYSGISRPQPLFLIISTAGDDLAGIGSEQYDFAKKILEGDRYDPETFVYIAAADPEDDWTKPATWKKANPSIGVSFDREQIAADCRRAQSNPAEETNFKRLRLNLWVGRGSSYIPMETWRSITDPVDPADLEGVAGFGGLDLSSNIDLTSFTLRFRVGAASKVLCWNWIPEKNIRQREKLDGVPYGRWIDEGLITPTPGDFIDLDRVRQDINEIAETYSIAEIAFDPAFASQIAIQLDADGFEIFRFRQSAGMMTPVLAELDRIVRAKLCHHGQNPVLQWAASNLEVSTTSDGLMKPVKPFRSARIDPIVALLMSLGPDIKVTADDGPSIYEDYDQDGPADAGDDQDNTDAPSRPRKGRSVYEDY